MRPISFFKGFLSFPLTCDTQDHAHPQHLGSKGRKQTPGSGRNQWNHKAEGRYFKICTSIPPISRPLLCTPLALFELTLFSLQRNVLQLVLISEEN